jgi:Flp pilus assembly protein TadB
MKILRITLLLIMGAFMFIQPVGAIVSSTHASATTIEQQQSASLKKEFKGQKKLTKMEKFLAKKGLDLSDPVKKWLLLAGVFAIAGIVLNILKISTIASLAWAAAGVCLIIWGLKYLEVF